MWVLYGTRFLSSPFWTFIPSWKFRFDCYSSSVSLRFRCLFCFMFCLVNAFSAHYSANMQNLYNRIFIFSSSGSCCRILKGPFYSSCLWNWSTVGIKNETFTSPITRNYIRVQVNITENMRLVLERLARFPVFPVFLILYHDRKKYVQRLWSNSK